MKPWLLSIFSLLFLGCASWPALAYEGWIGTYTYREEHRDKYEYSSKREGDWRGCNKNANCEDLRNFEVVVKFCSMGKGGDAINAQAEVNNNWNHQEACKWRQQVELCCGKKRLKAATSTERKECNKNRDHRAPGASGETEYSFTELGGEPVVKEASLSVHKDGRYHLRVSGHVDAVSQRKGNEYIKYACSGEEEKKDSPIIASLNKYSFGHTAEGMVSGNIISGEEILYEEKKVPVGGHCFFGGCNDLYYAGCGGDQTVHGNEYSRRASAKWHLKKVPCFGVITAVRGDVKMTPAPRPQVEKEGAVIGPEEAVTVGCVTNLGGALIETGRHSRLGIDLGDIQYRFGSNSKANLPENPCGPVGSASRLEGFFRAVVSVLVGEGGTFEMPATNAVNGRRGGLEPSFPWAVADSMLSNVGQFLIPIARAEESEEAELMPDQKALKKARAAFFIDNQPYDRVIVKVIKGMVEIKDPSGRVHRLETGQEFKMRWGTKPDHILISVKPPAR